MDPRQRRPRQTRSGYAFVVPGALGASYRGQVCRQLLANGLEDAAAVAGRVDLFRGKVLEVRTKGLAGRGDQGVCVEERALVLVGEVQCRKGEEIDVDASIADVELDTAG